MVNVYQNGAMPLHVVPLNEAERRGLSTYAAPGNLGGGAMQDAQGMLRNALKDPRAFGDQFIDPMASQYMGAAGDAVAAGIEDIGFDEVESMRNPYSAALKGRLSEAGEKAKAALLGTEGMRGARSFGDTMTGTRLGQLDRELLSKSSDIDYNTYNDAYGRLQAMRGLKLQGGQIYGNLGTSAQGIRDNAMSAGLRGIGALFDTGQVRTQQGLQNASNQIKAGQYVRDYNQSVADMVAGDMLDEQNYPRTNLANTIGLLKQLESGSGATPAAPTDLARVGAGLQLGAGVLSRAGAGGSSLPWQAPGNVRPDFMGGGFY